MHKYIYTNRCRTHKVILGPASRALRVQPAGNNVIIVSMLMLSLDEMFQPATSKWVTGTMKRHPVHCYLYSNALVVIPTDKKVYWYPLNGKLYMYTSKCCMGPKIIR